MNFLKNTLELIENDPEIKSYIYQQILDFNQFVTPETLVMVIARDPNGHYESESDEADYQINDEENSEFKNFKYRIAVILKEDDSSIEAEAYDNDIFEAIRKAKDKLIAELIEIQNEIENPQDRMRAIQEASDNKPVH